MRSPAQVDPKILKLMMSELSPKVKVTPADVYLNAGKPSCKNGRIKQNIIQNCRLQFPQKCGWLLRHYRPINFGFRLSAKAVTPSLISSEKLSR
jgi:hypothetical protein